MRDHAADATVVDQAHGAVVGIRDIRETARRIKRHAAWSVEKSGRRRAPVATESGHTRTCRRCDRSIRYPANHAVERIGDIHNAIHIDGYAARSVQPGRKSGASIAGIPCGTNACDSGDNAG